MIKHLALGGRLVVVCGPKSNNQTKANVGSKGTGRYRLETGHHAGFVVFRPTEGFVREMVAAGSLENAGSGGMVAVSAHPPIRLLRCH